MYYFASIQYQLEFTSGVVLSVETDITDVTLIETISSNDKFLLQPVHKLPINK